MKKKAQEDDELEKMLTYGNWFKASPKGVLNYKNVVKRNIVTQIVTTLKMEEKLVVKGGLTNEQGPEKPTSTKSIEAKKIPREETH